MSEHDTIGPMPLFSVAHALLVQVLSSDSNEGLQLEEVDCPQCRSSKGIYLNTHLISPYVPSAPTGKVAVLFRCVRCNWSALSDVTRTIVDGAIRFEIPKR